MNGLYRYAAQVAYMGGSYAGWQRQADAVGVQQVLEDALSKLSPVPVKTIGAGRTDKGVHAVGQVASFGMNKEWDTNRLQLAMNFYLPEDVRVLRVFAVLPEFDARRSALWREYKYFIWHGRVCPPHLNGFVWWRKHDWDRDLARQACKLIVGKHDFRAFCKAVECPENTLRDIYNLKFQKWGDLSVLTVRAPSFLTNMVRIIAGNIDAVAIKKNNLDWLENLLKGDERIHSAMTAPACGLWFWRAGYNEIKI